MAIRESRNEPQAVADAGPLSVQATAMTYAAIVMSQVGAGLAWRTNRRSIVEGLLSNWLFLFLAAVASARRKSARGSFAVGHSLGDRESRRET